MNTPQTPSSHHIPQALERVPAGFSFMKSIVRMCRNLSSDDAVAWKEPSDMVYFQRGESGAEFDPRGKIHPKSVAIRADRVMRLIEEGGACEEINAASRKVKGFPRIRPHTRVTHIDMGLRPGVREEDATELTDLRISEKDRTIHDFLVGKRKEFTEKHTVNAVKSLAKHEELYVQFKEDGQLYAITVTGDSFSPDGKRHAAFCNIAYQVRGEDGKMRSQSREGLLYLPLATGGHMLFTERVRDRG